MSCGRERKPPEFGLKSRLYQVRACILWWLRTRGCEAGKISARL